MKTWKLGLIGSAAATVLIASTGVAFLQSRLAHGDEPSRGPGSAAVNLVVFCDFQCPLCASMAPVLNQLVAVHPSDLRLVYRHFPVPRIHPDATRAAEAASCAQDQGRFWDMYASMLSHQDALGEGGLVQQAGDVGLDWRTFAKCLDNGQHDADWRRDLSDGHALGVTGTPTFFVNGKFIEGTRTFDQLDAYVRAALGR